MIVSSKRWLGVPSVNPLNSSRACMWLITERVAVGLLSNGIFCLLILSISLN